MMIHNLDPIIVDFGFMQIRWYSIAYILGILLGWIYAKNVAKNIQKKNNYILIKQKDLDDLIVYIIVGILVGGRLGYVFFYNLTYYSENLFEIIQIWKGGMSFHGGLIGVVFSSFIFSKKNKMDFLRLTDIVACSAPIGLFFGRIANFINGELYGKASTLPWSVIFPMGGNISRHPSQLYESLLEGIMLFAIINFIALKKKVILRTGLISSLFLIFYSVVRIIGEMFREPDQHLGYFFNFISMGTVLSVITLIVGLLMLYKKNYEKNI